MALSEKQRKYIIHFGDKDKQKRDYPMDEERERQNAARRKAERIREARELKAETDWWRE